MADPQDAIWGTWAWVALAITVALCALLITILVHADLFHGARMGKLIVIICIFGIATPVFWLCHLLRHKPRLDP